METTTFQEAFSPIALAACFADVRRRSQAAGSDGVTPGAYAGGLERRVARLSAALVGGTWKPAKLVRIQQRKPSGGTRRLAIPTVEDRVVIEALRRVLEPRIERVLSDAAFAYRPDRSARVAVEAVVRGIEEGAAWAAVADVREFFDSVRVDHVLAMLDEIAAEQPVRRLLERVLRGHALAPGRGLAQGSALSPALSNLAMVPFDRRLLAAGFDLVRYCDNLCITATLQPGAERALEAMTREARRLGLALKEGASRVVEVREGFLWLGFWLGAGGGRVSEGAVEALQQRLDAAGRGLSGPALAARLGPIVRGWVQYFDAPLPEGADLGQHDPVVRALLAEHGVSAIRTGQSRAGHEVDRAAADASAAAEAEGDAEIWDGGAEPWDGSGHLPEDDAAGAQEAVDELLSEADRLAMAGAYGNAEAAYAKAQRVAAEAAAPPVAEEGNDNERPSDEPVDDELVDAYLGLFAAGQQDVEIATGAASGRRAFERAARAPSPADVRSHLAGRKALAVRPRLPDGTATLGVLDVDGPAAPADAGVHAYAEALCAVARAWGWHVLVEDTGGRGIHVWVPVSGRMRAGDLSKALEALEREAGRPREGVRVERLPAPDAAADLHEQAMTLPLGVHLETRVASRLRWAAGPEVAHDLTGLLAHQPNAPDDVLRVMAEKEAARAARGGHADRAVAEPRIAEPEARGAEQTEPTEWRAFGPAVSRVMAGCAVLRRLAEKAGAVGHLDHGERLSFLYSFGHLGAPGNQAIHAIVGRCANYDAEETDRQIRRLTGLPIGCARLREKHATPAVMPLCNCDFGDVRRRGGYPTPLLHSAGFRRTWRDELRGRRDAEAAMAGRADKGVVALPEPGPPRDRAPAGGDAEDEGSGISVAGAPPHEWA